MAECRFCDRDCPRCRWPIKGGWEHVEQPQAATSNVVVCNLVRHIGPLVDVLAEFMAHQQHRSRGEGHG